jgi:hypothetical protein
MVGAVKFPGQVKSAGLVVELPRARERHEYRGLVLALQLPS